MRLITYILILFITSSASAQITTASIKGLVKDAEGSPLPAAYLSITHLPTGSSFEVYSTVNGDFRISGLRPGGPYELSASFTGMKDFTKTIPNLSIGETHQTSIQLVAKSSEISGVTIIGTPNFKGSQTKFDADQIAKMPTLNRGLQDATRLSPQGGLNSFGGNNYRFNNLNIDGASLNDVIGFQEPASGAGGTTASGTPGSLAGTQPISLDAVDQVQVSIAPFDVKYGNFTGANLNVITKGGSNELKGTVYGFGRNKTLSGTQVNGVTNELPAFNDNQFGVSLSGPIIKNKLFLFVNGEMARRNEPLLSAPGDVGVNIPIAVAQGLKDTLISRYNLDPGSFGAITNQTNSDKIFARLDYELSDRHKLTLRHNYVTGFADRLERSSNILNFSTQAFRHHTATNSSVLEIRSLLSSQLTNNLKIGYNQIESDRTYEGEPTPHVQILYNTSNSILFGSYREAAIHGSSTDVLQISDNLNWTNGKHYFTLGTNNEIMLIKYRFLTAWNGRWEYSSLQDFYDNQPKRIRGVYHYDDNSFEFNKNNPSAAFRVHLYSLFFQDEIEVSNKLNLTAGIRLDAQQHPMKVPILPAIAESNTFSEYTNKFGGRPDINPRFAFNYSIDDNQKSTLRGGAGLFTGRIPFVWYAYSHYISGHNYGNVDLRPNGTYAFDPNPANLSTFQTGLTEINLVDNDFRLPRSAKFNLSYEHQFNNGISISTEALFSKALKAIDFKTLNLVDSTATLDGADNRSYYVLSGNEKKIHDGFTNVFLLTNTNKGYSYNLSFTIQQQLAKFQWRASYNFGESKDISNGVRSSMAANFNWNQSINSNNPDLAYSNFDIRHRVLGFVHYDILQKKNCRTSIGLVASLNAGAPFSYTYAGDLNRDGSSQNDLIYIPANEQEISLIDFTNSNGNLVTAEEQWRQLDQYISSYSYLDGKRGDYVDRNGGRTPWNNSIDLRLTHHQTIGKKYYIEATFDLFNFGALLHSTLGNQYFVPNVTNSSYQLLKFKGLEGETPTFTFDKPVGDPWLIDPVASRWQAQMGLRFGF